MSSGKNPSIISQHFAFQLVWQNTRLLWLCIQTITDIFLPIKGCLREQAFLLSALCCAFLATGDVTQRWLAVDTNDMSYVLKLACGNLKSLSCAETDQFTPLQLSLQPFGLAVNLCCRTLLLAQFTPREIKPESEQKQKRAAELLAKGSYATSLQGWEKISIQQYIVVLTPEIQITGAKYRYFNWNVTVNRFCCQFNSPASLPHVSSWWRWWHSEVDRRR